MVGRCLVYWAGLQDVDRHTDPCLSDDERARALSFRRAEDRHRFTTGALLLRRAVADLAGCAPSAVVVRRSCPHCHSSRHGRPTVDNPGGLHVSVTHSGDLVGVAVSSSGPVGIDVEQVTAPGVRAPAGGLAGSATVEEFLTTWTETESALKALGVGLAVSLDDFDLVRIAGDRIRLRLGAAQTAARLIVLHPPTRHHVARLTSLTAEPVVVEERVVSLAAGDHGAVRGCHVGTCRR